MNRTEFLAQKWNSYPLLPQGVSFLGRVHNIQHSGAWQVTLLREGRLQTREFVKLFLTELPTEDLCTFLAVGDLVAVSEEGAVTLLAPQLQKPPLRTLSLDTLHLWQEYLRFVHEFFRERGFLYVSTPNLVRCPGTEPSLDVFSTELFRGSRREKLYLPTSPELHLKKALALGAEKIYEIKTCFRNGEVTAHHQPEFSMIEWYRAYETLSSIRRDVIDLVEYLAGKMPSAKTPSTTERFRVSQLFQQKCGFDLKPDTGIEEMKKLALKLGVDVSSATQIDDYFFLLFMEKIEKTMDPESLIFVEDYPPYQAALARLTAEGWGDRFEVYWQGFELANAFHELNDPEVQKQRFADDLMKKRKMGKEEIPLDEEFLKSLEAGMPPSSGIALGLDRLFMALTGIHQIADTRLFPVL